MEAPKKLYVDTEDRLSDSILYGFTKKRKDDDIEYIRKDAFIEKVCEWIKKNVYFYTWYDFKQYEIGVETDKLIEDLKNIL